MKRPTLSKTKIPYLDFVWNVTSGCSNAGWACDNCYAKATHDKWHGVGQRGGKVPPRYNEPFSTIQLHEDLLQAPMRRQKRAIIGVCFMSDLFHPEVPDEFIDKVMAVIALSPQHRFVILTKRPERMADYMHNLLHDEFRRGDAPDRITPAVNAVMALADKDWGACHSTSSNITTASKRTGAKEPGQYRLREDGLVERWDCFYKEPKWVTLPAKFSKMLKEQGHVYDGEYGWHLKAFPFYNLMIGCTVWDQRSLDNSILHLLRAPADWRFVSYEPALGPINLTRTAFSDALRMTENHPALDWVVMGCEKLAGNKPGRPMENKWAGEVATQCKEAGVPFFLKQQVIHGRVREPENGFDMTDAIEAPAWFDFTKVPLPQYLKQPKSASQDDGLGPVFNTDEDVLF